MGKWIVSDWVGLGCAKYGKVATTRWAVVLVALGLGLAGFLMAGLSRVKILEDLTDLWVEEGTRLQEERAAYNAKFGGLQREGVAAITPTDGNGVANTVGHLEALLNVSTTVLAFDTEGALFVEVENANGEVVSFNEGDFCQVPEVPQLFRPLDPNSVTVDNLYSWSYARISICLAKEQALIDPTTGEPVEPLSNDWGVDRFPCIRTTVLDCFTEGDFDYPSSLKELSGVSPAVLAAKEGTVSESSLAVFQACVDDLELVLFDAIFLADTSDAARAEELADTVVETLVDYIIPLLFTWGYHWRPSFQGKNPDQIAALLDEAVRNSQDPSVTAEDCAREGMTCCTLWNGIPVDLETFMGDYTTGSGGEVLAVGALRTAWLNLNANDDFLIERMQEKGVEGEEQRTAVVLAWEQAVIDLYLPKYEREEGTGFAPSEEFATAKLDFFMNRSSTDVVQEGSSVPWALVAGAYVIMITYSFVVFFDWHWPFGAENFRNSRVLLALAGIGVITLATASGFGVLGWAGVKLSPISTNLIPFLALGVGLDDMFVLLNAIINPNVRERLTSSEAVMSEAMLAAGPSVVLTSLSILVAFLVSSVVRIQAIYTFCYQVAATVAFNLLFLFLIFVPLCALDARRFLAGRLECLPCLSGGNDADGDAEDAAEGEAQTELREAATAREHRTIAIRFGDFAGSILGPKVILRNKWSKFSIVSVFSLLFVAMLVCGIVLSESGLPLQDVALEGSYQNSYVNIQEAYFTSYGSFLVTDEETENFQAVVTQQAMLDQQLSLQTAAKVSTNPPIRNSSWFADSPFSFLAFYNGQEDLPLDTPIPENLYYGTLAQWAVTAGLSFGGDIWCYNATLDEPVGDRTRIRCEADDVDPLDTLGTSNSTVRLATARQNFIQRDLVKTDDFVEAIRSSRERTDELNVDGNHAFVYGYVYEFWEQYLNIWNNLYKVVGLALAGVFVIVLLFLLSIRVSCIIVVLILSVVVDLFGIMTLLGVKVNAISITNYAVAVGLTVEFLAHYAHAYLACTEGDRNSRAQGALRIMFGPSTNGYLSTVLALLVVVANEFPFVRLYYFGMLFTMVSLAYLHGMILLPVLVSWLGPLRGEAAEGKALAPDQAIDEK